MPVSLINRNRLSSSAPHAPRYPKPPLCSRRSQSPRGRGVLPVGLFFVFGCVLPLGMAPSESVAQTIVAVIDTGVDAAHPDLQPYLVPGWDFVDNDPDPEDINGHGTEMAGLILAACDDGDGPAPDCKIGALRVTDAPAVDQGLIAQAITEAIAPTWDGGIAASIIYIGAGAVGNDPRVAAAVDAARQAGVLVVAPAGSEGLNQTLYPAALDSALENVVSVVAVDAGGELLRSANTSGRETVAVMAERVQTTSLDGAYVERSGSSVAAATAAGVAGAVLAKEPGLSAAQVRQILQAAVDPASARGLYGLLEPVLALQRTSLTFRDVAVRGFVVLPGVA